jgi:hypothetical protein
MANTEAIARLKGQLSHLVVEFNRIEEEEFQSQDMARGQYMFDEDCSNNSHHEHAQTTTNLVSEEIADEVVSEFSLEDSEMEHFAQDKDDLDLDKLIGQDSVLYEASLEDPEVECFSQSDLDLNKFLEQAKTFREPNLDDPLEESFAQFEFDLDLDMIYEQAKALLDPTPEMRTENGEEVKEEHLEQVEHREQIEPPPDPSNDKEVSIETHSLVTIPLEIYHEPQVLSFQCLEEPSYVEIFKESHTEDHKSMNGVLKWIPRNKVNYIRWQKILPEGYLILKNKGWKGLVRHPYERGRRGNFSFYFPHFNF